jgi:mannitol/fructose-specific phosphotransferase system IIA component (Ntr-type)
MDLTALLPQEHVVLNLSGSSRRELMQALVAPLIAADVVTDCCGYLADLERRESQITTQMGKGIAFPHARSNAVRRLGLSVGIAGENGVTFNEQQPEKCRLFFLIAIPAYAPTAHLPLLQHLAHFAQDEAKVDRLLASSSPLQVARFLTSFKG